MCLTASLVFSLTLLLSYYRFSPNTLVLPVLPCGYVWIAICLGSPYQWPCLAHGPGWPDLGQPTAASQGYPSRSVSPVLGFKAHPHPWPGLPKQEKHLYSVRSAVELSFPPGKVLRHSRSLIVDGPLLRTTAPNQFGLICGSAPPRAGGLQYKRPGHLRPRKPLSSTSIPFSFRSTLPSSNAVTTKRGLTHGTLALVPYQPYWTRPPPRLYLHKLESGLEHPGVDYNNPRATTRRLQSTDTTTRLNGLVLPSVFSPTSALSGDTRAPLIKLARLCQLWEIHLSSPKPKLCRDPITLRVSPI